MKKYAIILAFVFLAGQTPSTDDSDVWHNIVKIPPSPNAEHLGTYGEYSVSKASGSADISVPIIAIEDGGISIPVSLSYQSSGLKVDERPSWVGMGWILNAGGVITRTIRGKCDEDAQGFFHHMTDIPFSGSIDDDLQVPTYRGDVYDRLDKIARNEFDYEPDSYAFNFGGNGGSFFFGNDGNAHCVDHSSLKFQPIYGIYELVSTSPIIIGWNATDNNGLIYTFKAIETTQARPYDQLMDRYISAWYLTSIQNPLTGMVATFAYDPATYNFDYENTSHQKRWTRGSGLAYYDGPVESSSTTTINHDNVKFLSSITLNNYQLNFSTSLSGEDGFRKLNSITWTNGSNTRTFSLGYSNFTGECGTQCNRLKLTSLSETTIPANLKTHNFEYYPGEVPAKDSYSQDHWGYFNGKNNASLIPDVEYDSHTFGSHADRSVDYGSTLIGMLKTITYPTGGSTTFYYDQNTWEDVTTQEEVEIVGQDVNIPAGSGPGRLYGEEGTQGEVCTNSYIYLLEGGDGGISPNTQYTFEIEMTVHINGAPNMEDPHDYGELTITEISSNDVIKTIFVDGDNATVTETVPHTKLTPGDGYIFRLCAKGGDTWAKANVKVIEFTPGDEGQPIGRQIGGLRLSRIDNYDPESNATLTRTFDYGFGGYVVHQVEPSYFNSYFNGTSFSVTVSDSPPGGLGPSSMPVAYEKVNEWIGTPSSNNGRIETTFRKRKDEVHGLTLPESMHSVRTKVSCENYYNSGGALLKYENFNYYEELAGQMMGFKAKRINISSPIDYLNDFAYANFYVYSRWHQLVSKKTAHIYSGTEISETATYEYDPDNLHTNPIKETRTNSKGETLSTEYTYPSDKTNCSNTCFVNYLTDLNACAGLNDQHALLAQSCLTAYTGCYMEWRACRAAEQDAVDDDCIISGSIPCAMRKARQFACNEKFNDCLGSSGFYACVDALGETYFYERCQKEAFLGYRMCQDNYDNCLLDEYDNGSTVDQKAVALLNMENVLSAPIELKDLKATTELSKKSLEYGLWSEIPRQKSASISYHGTTPTTVITFNQYDSKGNPTEVLDNKQGLVKSYVWGYDQSLLIAEFQNASLVDVGYSSFESGSNEGGLTFTLAPSSGGKTGEKGHLLNTKSIGKSGLTTTKKYVVSYWAKDGTPSVNGVVSSNDGIAEADGWTFYNKTVTGVSTITISGTGTTKIDEVRIGPESSVVTTFTYQRGFGIRSSTDQNGKTTYYDYDDSGRLISVADHYHQILRTLNYHYR